MKANFVDIPRGFELKEISIAKDHEFVLLFKEKLLGKINEKGYSMLNLLDLSELKQEKVINLGEGINLRDDTQVFFLFFLNF